MDQQEQEDKTDERLTHLFQTLTLPPPALRQATPYRELKIARESCLQNWNFSMPKNHYLGVNPHAGDPEDESCFQSWILQCQLSSTEAFTLWQ